MPWSRVVDKSLSQEGPADTEAAGCGGAKGTLPCRWARKGRT